MLGICRGIQTLAMALGGRVTQHIDTAIKHSQDAARTEPTHTVGVEPDSALYKLYRTPKLYVNSFHHQAVADPGPRFKVAATAADGTIEAMESSELKSIMGVQWHPEWLAEAGLPLFKWLVDAAATFAQARRMHSRLLTLDTHCDTPMFFPQGVDFGRRDDRILVDLHKMADGQLDATTMVAYLPQPKEGQSLRGDSSAACRVAPGLCRPYLRPHRRHPATLQPGCTPGSDTAGTLSEQGRWQEVYRAGHREWTRPGARCGQCAPLCRQGRGVHHALPQWRQRYMRLGTWLWHAWRCERLWRECYP